MSEAAERDSGIIEHVGNWKRRHIKPKQRRKARWRWLKLGIRDTPPPAFRGLYEEPTKTEDHLGVCCSGGGVRSAAFNLGALQALERERELQKARYLSAVSGGSYIASAFCMVAKTRETPGLDPEVFNDKAGLPFGPGTPEEQYLRNHLSYLAPDGLAKVYLGLRMVSGLLVNILLIGLPILIAGLLIGALFDGPYGEIADGTISVPNGVLYPILLAAVLSAIIAVADIVSRPGKDVWQRATETWEVRLFLVAVAGAVALIVVPWLAARAAHYNNAGLRVGDAADDGVIRSAQAALGSMIALAGAAITHVRGAIRDHQKTIEAAETRLGRFARQARNAIVAVVVLLAGPLLLVAVAALGVLISVNSEDEGVTLLFVAGGVLAAMWFVVDLTTVSLHPFYRRRLSSAFALRRVRAGEDVIAEDRPFNDHVKLSQTDVGGDWPMLIVCAAANISDPGATPPGRGVASFTFSPTAIGGPLTGASATERYEALARNRARDVTLPAAVAMSGAAVSPSMGKLTYRPLTFLLALANIRLGVWVLNPRRINESTETMATGRNLLHRPRPQYLWKELFGRNRLEDKFLYVTDGGHYENLGLLELLRRGCRTIYCFDAGGGNTNKALVDAIALARTELNIQIDMTAEAEKLAEDNQTRLAKVVCASGTILYPAARAEDRVQGRLFYVRSVVSDESPWDLRSFQLEDGIFPHDSTFDQFFTDQKFEAYRRLGTCAAEQAMIMAKLPVATKDETVTAVVVQAPKYTASGKLKLEFEPEEPPLN
jgi:hypothetical protein